MGGGRVLNLTPASLAGELGAAFNIGTSSQKQLPALNLLRLHNSSCSSINPSQHLSSKGKGKGSELARKGSRKRKG
jgi:hypothetical protein